MKGARLDDCHLRVPGGIWVAGIGSLSLSGRMLWRVVALELLEKHGIARAAHAVCWQAWYPHARPH